MWDDMMVPQAVYPIGPAMYYEIQSIESLEASDLTHSIVWFWENRAAYVRSRSAPLFEEEFISDLRDSATRVVADGQGRYKLTDGSFVATEDLDPKTTYDFERETIKLNPAEQLLGYIESFIERREPDILAGRLGTSRVSQTPHVRPTAERSAIARDTRLRAVVRSPRDARSREVRR